MKRVITDSENKNLDNIFCMSNLPASKLGLPVSIWVDDVGQDRKPGHNDPRIKVNNTYGDKYKGDTYTLTISKTPDEHNTTPKISEKDQKTMKQFVINHYDDLMAHWNREITTDELKEKLYIH